jgi:hypothetical protein
MISYVEYVSWDQVVVYLSGQLSISAIDTLISGKIPINRLKIENWQQLRQEIGAGEDLFETAQQNVLVDIQSLLITQQSIDYILEVQKANPETTIYFYSTVQETLPSEIKKIWQKASFEYIQLKKIDEALKLGIAKAYTATTELKLSDKQILEVSKLAQTYQEVIDILDLLDVSGDIPAQMKTLAVEEKPLPFMLGFNIDRLKQDVLNWYKLINEDEVQLGLSLIYTKLEKQSGEKAKLLLKKLIETDQKIKTGNKISQYTQWKKFLWESRGM